MTKLTKIIKRRTGTPANHYGKDAQRDLVVYLVPGSMGRDIVQIKPSGTRRSESILVSDLWAHMLRCKAGQAWREKMEVKKAAKKTKLEAAAARKATAKLAREIFSPQS